MPAAVTIARPETEAHQANHCSREYSHRGVVIYTASQLVRSGAPSLRAHVGDDDATESVRCGLFSSAFWVGEVIR
jgi:hypothetical protein